MLDHVSLGKLTAGSVPSYDDAAVATNPVFLWLILKGFMMQHRHGSDRDSDSREMVAYIFSH